MNLRRIRRAVALSFALAFCVVRYWLMRLRAPMTQERRALWLQAAACGVLQSLHVEVRVEGNPPACGLVVANHLSYLDIIAFSAAMPCFFVAKAEIDRWPYFGRTARAGGTIFIERSSLKSARAVAAQIFERLKMRVPVLLFPEGTSTDGATVQRFHSRLIDPAVKAGAPITAAAIHYIIDGGVRERELCWYGDEKFMPHLWRVLGMEKFSAVLQFGEPRIYADRRVAADRTHAEVAGMREAEIVAAL